MRRPTRSLVRPSAPALPVVALAAVAVLAGCREPGPKPAAVLAPSPAAAPLPAAASSSPGPSAPRVPDARPTATGFRPVGDRTAVDDRWSATCTGGYAFAPQAWYLPVSQHLFKDLTGHPETAAVLASVRFDAPASGG